MPTLIQGRKKGKFWEEKHNKENPILSRGDINKVLDEMEAKRKFRKEYRDGFFATQTHEFDHLYN